MSLVEPRTPGGFPEFLPPEQMVLEEAKTLIKRWFERFGFVPVETPAVELKTVLSAKGSMKKQIYTVGRFLGEQEALDFLSLALNPDAGEELKEKTRKQLSKMGLAESDDVRKDQLRVIERLMGRSQTDMALHFDLTVPLARYVSGNKEKLVFPLRRYQMQKVWRGERPQAGRFREFYQCDIDVIGREFLDPMFDAEIPSIIYQIFSEMRIGKFVIRISNAKILEEYLMHAGVAQEALSEARGAIDELEKIGTIRTVEALVSSAKVSQDVAERIVAFLRHDQNDTDATLKELEGLSVSERFAIGVRELKDVVEGVRMLGVPDENFRVDLTIARGLDYYTGTVYETVLVDHPGIGSICSGGRYDELAGYFSEEKFPGVGISIGLTRLVTRLLSVGILKVKRGTTASVLVTTIDRTRMADYLQMATAMRRAGIDCEIYLGDDPLGKQLRYADRKGFAIAVIAGEKEFAENSVQVKSLKAGGAQRYLIQDLVSNVHYLLGLIAENQVKLMTPR